MKKFEEMFKRITNWDDLVIGKRYYIVCTGKDWLGTKDCDCVYVYNEKAKEDVLLEEETDSYFTKDCLVEYDGDYMIVIFEYLEEE